MSFSTTMKTVALVLTSAMLVGCGQSTPVADEHGHDHEHEAVAATGHHDHSAWWCAEHGVPEEVCSRCSPKIAADFQKKGDWCAEHNRAQSQCFLCDPSLKDRFAEQHKAKLGTEPPALPPGELPEGAGKS